MKNKWVKRIATAVATLAVAAGVFTGLGNSAEASDTKYMHADGTVDGESVDAVLCFNSGSTYDDISVSGHTVTFRDFVDPGDLSIYEEGWTLVFEGTNSMKYFSIDTSAVRVGVSEGSTLSVEHFGDYAGATTLSSGTIATPELSNVEVGDSVVFSNENSSSDDDDDTDDTTPSGSNDSKPSDAGSSSSSHKHHTHNWEWTAIVNATENQDGTYAMKCTRCKSVDESTITVVAKEAVTSDKNLQILGSVKPGETIKLDTKGTAAFNQYFIAEIMKHSDSPVVVDFEYKNKKWTMTAPAGFNWAANLDANGWAGFMSVAQNNAEVTVTER